MTIELKKCTSDNHKIVKEFDGTSLSKTGTLRQPSSIMDPIIQVEGDATITEYNYMEISSFGRKYYISNITSVANGLWEIHGHVDVLGTYAQEILATEAILDKREAAPDYYIDDGSVIMDDRTVEQVCYFKGDMEDGDYYTDEDGNCCFDPAGWNYVLIAAGPSETIPDPEPEPEP